MNYSLTLNELQNIDLSKISIDKRQSFKLEYIDSITMECESEEELKKYLLEKELINEEDLEKNICISYGKKTKRYISILYKNNKETVRKIKELADEIKKYFQVRKNHTNNDFSYSLIMGDYGDITKYFDSFQVFAGNHKFLRALQEYASNNPKQNLNINDISVYIKDSNTDKKAKVIYIALFEIFRRLFYNYDDENKSLEFNYKGFRDFCVFYCEYKANLHMNKQGNVENEILIEEEIKEPEFPPNSEEERNYKRYLRELEECANNEPIENNPHYRR